MNSEDYILNRIQKSIKELIVKEIDEKIDEQVEKFRKELIDNKDKYIAEIMKGIRIFAEMQNPEHCPRFKIEFENIYRIES